MNSEKETVIQSNKLSLDLDLGAIVLVLTPINNLEGLRVNLRQYRGDVGQTLNTEEVRICDMMYVLGRGLTSLAFNATEYVYNVGQQPMEGADKEEEVVGKDADLASVQAKGNC